MNARLRENQIAYDNQSPLEPSNDPFALTPFEAADEKVRRDELLMSELIGEVTAITDDNWLVQALIHYHRTGDFTFVKNQCDKHIEPVIDGAVQKEMERAARSWQ